MSNPYSEPGPHTPYRPQRRLVRSRADKMVAGVCGGAASYAGIDPTLMRLLFVAATVFTGGAGLLLYVAGWILMPQD